MHDEASTKYMYVSSHEAQSQSKCQLRIQILNICTFIRIYAFIYHTQICVIFCYAIVCFSFSVARVALVTTAWVAEFSALVVVVFYSVFLILCACVIILIPLIMTIEISKFILLLLLQCRRCCYCCIYVCLWVARCWSSNFIYTNTC